MIKFIQTFNIVIFVISFQIKTAIQSLSDFNSQNFNSKELAKDILPSKYHYLSDVYCAIKHSNQRENIVGLLQCFDTIKTSYNLPLEIQKKIIFMTIGKFFSFSKIEICPDPPTLYLDTFQYFTVTKMERYQGRIFQNYDITIKPKNVGSFFDLTNELTINYIACNFNLNSFILQFFLKNDFFKIKLQDQEVILEIKDCEWDTVVKDLDQNFIDIPQDINLLKGKINAAQRYKSNSITLSPNEEILFKSKMPFFNLYELNYETFQNFQNKVKKYNVNINNDIHSQENYACKIGSTITIIDLVSKNKKQKIFPKEIALKACVSEDEILAVELINEHIYSNEYGNYHFKGKPNPTYHVIKIYDLLTNKLLNIIRLPLPQHYFFEHYDFSLYGIQKNNVYIYAKKENAYIKFQYDINEKYNDNQTFDTKVSTTINHEKIIQEKTDQSKPQPEEDNSVIKKENEDIQPNQPKIQPTNSSKKAILGYIKQKIKYIAFISSVFIAFFIFQKYCSRFFSSARFTVNNLISLL